VLGQDESRQLTVMLLGYQASQRRKVDIGKYTLHFNRKRAHNRYFYIVELKEGKRVVERGMFEEYGKAVNYAGSIMFEKVYG